MLFRVSMLGAPRRRLHVTTRPPPERSVRGNVGIASPSRLGRPFQHDHPFGLELDVLFGWLEPDRTLERLGKGIETGEFLRCCCKNFGLSISNMDQTGGFVAVSVVLMVIVFPIGSWLFLVPCLGKETTWGNTCHAFLPMRWRQDMTTGKLETIQIEALRGRERTIQRQTGV